MCTLPMARIIFVLRTSYLVFLPQRSMCERRAGGVPSSFFVKCDKMVIHDFAEKGGAFETKCKDLGLKSQKLGHLR